MDDKSNNPFYGPIIMKTLWKMPFKGVKIAKRGVSQGIIKDSVFCIPEDSRIADGNCRVSVMPEIPPLKRGGVDKMLNNAYNAMGRQQTTHIKVLNYCSI